MTEEEENCWICKKIISNDEDKVRHHCHVTSKFRGAAHDSCNLSFQLTKKVPVIFHNLRSSDSHLIFNKLDKCDVKIKVIPNGLEKYMPFFLNKILVFIDSMQFMNSSLDILVKYLSDKDFKYLIKEFRFKNLELLKPKGTYCYEYMNSLKGLMKKNYMLKNIFIVL